MVTTGAPVRLHRIRNDQLYHYYLGDPLETILLHSDGSFERIIVGPDIRTAQRLQLLIPGNTFHTARLLGRRRWFLGHRMARRHTRRCGTRTTGGACEQVSGRSSRFAVNRRVGATQRTNGCGWTQIESRRVHIARAGKRPLAAGGCPAKLFLSMLLMDIYRSTEPGHVP